MLKKINYTGRRKILKNEATFSIHKEENNVSFDVNFKLDTTDIPDHASLYVEAYYQETRQRFSFGRIDEQKPPKDRLLNEINLSGNTLFRILIVDEESAHGKLLASGEQFRVWEDDKNNSQSLIAVEVKDLGSEVWKIEFDDCGEPELCIDRKIPDAINRISDDIFFQSLILPAAFREILTWYFWQGDEFGGEKRERWMEFAEVYGGKIPKHLEDQESIVKWVDEVVMAFSSQFKLCEKFVEKLEDK
jgi:hypothetical protein